MDKQEIKRDCTCIQDKKFFNQKEAKLAYALCINIRIKVELKYLLQTIVKRDPNYTVTVSSVLDRFWINQPCVSPFILTLT